MWIRCDFRYIYDFKDYLCIGKHTTYLLGILLHDNNLYTHIHHISYIHTCLRLYERLKKIVHAELGLCTFFFLVGKRKQKKSFSSNGYTLTINYNHIFELVSVLKFFNVCCLLNFKRELSHG